MQEEAKIFKHIEQLIEACLKGDRQSQSRLYNTYKQKMFIICLRFSKTREEAEEILQEGFMKVFEFLHIEIKEIYILLLISIPTLLSMELMKT